VKVTHLGFLNEPDFSTTYASMVSNGYQSADFIKILHPTLQRANLSNVLITCCDATGWKAQTNMTKDLKAAGVEDLIGVMTSHPYSSALDGPLPTTRKVWETEFSDLAGKWSTDWYTAPGATGDGYRWAYLIHTGLTTGNVSAYLWWVGTQDRETNGNNNEKLILVDKGDYFVSKRFWAFAQYSRPIRPGAVRVAVSGGTSLLATAFVNVDGSVVVVAINTGAEAQGLEVAGVKAAVAKAWVTDATRDMAPVGSVVGSDASVGGVSVPGRGLVSLVITPA